MALICEIPSEDTYDLPEGSYRARLVKVHLQTKQSAKGCIETLRMLFSVQIPSIKNKIPMAGRSFHLDLQRHSDLRGFVEAWQGGDCFAVESGRFDFEQLVGKEADVVLRHYHNDRHDRPYVNIESIHPPGKLRLTERPLVVPVETAKVEDGGDNETAEWREVA